MWYARLGSTSSDHGERCPVGDRPNVAQRSGGDRERRRRIGRGHHRRPVRERVERREREQQPDVALQQRPPRLRHPTAPTEVAEHRLRLTGDPHVKRDLFVGKPFAVFLWPAQITARAAGSVVVLAVVCTAAAFLVMFALIAEAGPARMTLITYINPVVAILLGALILDEPITVGLAIGFPLIILGSILGTWRSAPPPDAVVTATDAVEPADESNVR